MEKLLINVGDSVKLKNQAIFGSYMGKTSDGNKIWFLDCLKTSIPAQIEIGILLLAKR